MGILGLPLYKKIPFHLKLRPTEIGSPNSAEKKNEPVFQQRLMGKKTKTPYKRQKKDKLTQLTTQSVFQHVEKPSQTHLRIKEAIMKGPK